MQDTLSLGDVFKILLKKIKSILLLTVLLTAGAAVWLSMTDLLERPETHEVRVYGLIQYQHAEIGTELSYVTNNVSEIYKSDVLLWTLQNIDLNQCSDAFLSRYGASRDNASIEAKKELALKISKDYEVKFDSKAQLFQLSLIGEDVASQEYILQYLFEQGKVLSKEYIPDVDIQLLNKETIALEEASSMLADKNRVLVVVGCIIFFFVWLGWVLKFVFSETVISAEQFKRRYAFPTFGMIKNNEQAYAEAAQAVIYRLRRNQSKQAFFLSSTPKQNDMKMLEKLKAAAEKGQISVALASGAAGSDQKETGVFSARENEFVFTYLPFLSTSGLDGTLSEEKKNLILLVRCGKTKFSDIEAVLERMDLFDEEIDGVLFLDV